MAPGTRIDTRLQALAVARDCARLGARVRTIHQLTGLSVTELRQLLFTAQHPPPRGRAPDTREWYHGANLLERIEASVLVANFSWLRQVGFHANDALLAAYRGYSALYGAQGSISFDRAFDLAANTAGLWTVASACFQVLPCPCCHRRYLDAVGADARADRCPFCRLVARHRRDPRLTAAFRRVPAACDPIAQAWLARLSLPRPDGGDEAGSGNTTVAGCAQPPAAPAW